MRMQHLEASIREVLGGRGLEGALDNSSPEKTVKIHEKDVHTHRVERVGESENRQPQDGRIGSERKGGIPVDEKKMNELIEELNGRLEEDGIQLKYLLNEDSGDIQVEIREADSKRVLRKIPPDDLVRLSASLKEVSTSPRVGKLLDTSS